MRLSKLQSFRGLSLLIGIAAVGLVGGCGQGEGATGGGGGTGGATGGAGGGGTGGVSGPCSTTGVTCTCNFVSPGNCNRVHIGNLNEQAGITVVLEAGLQRCTINQLIVNEPGGIELDQCLMNIAVGDEVVITPALAAQPGDAATCRVNSDANVPGLPGELQTFAEVGGQPVAAGCGVGFTMTAP